MTQTLTIRYGSRIKDALRQLEDTEQKTLFVVDEESRLLGTLTDGDIRRWILAEGSLDGPVEDACNRDPFVSSEAYDPEEIRGVMLERKIGCVPIINVRREIVEILLWEELFGKALCRKPGTPIRLPVVIMAGGKGTRLDPFTKILPKPLIPLGDKTVIEIIIDSFVDCGVDDFYVSINYKSKIIKSFFEELSPAYSVRYLHEDKPLGTAGSLRFLCGALHGSLIVTNCDVIINADYHEMIEYHVKSDNDITLVASLKNYNIPYGVCEIQSGGSLNKITEKPEYNLLVNTGMYILKAETLQLIPENRLFHITELIQSVKVGGGKIGVFPISDKSWIDTGEWSEYKKALDNINYILA